MTGTRGTFWTLPRRLAASILLVLSACAGGGRGDVPATFVRISIDKSEPERLLTYYFGGYVSPEPSDPFEAGLMHRRDGNLYVDRDALERYAPAAAEHLSDSDDDGRIDWDELEAFIDRTYNRARSAPAVLDTLVSRSSFDAADPDWMQIEVDGVMTTARRRIFVRKSAVRNALQDYRPNDGRILYPVGTIFFGEHYLDGELAETTVMRKREDGYWDFFVYGSDDSLARGTTTPPRELKAPVQCVGCHFGDKIFEPERSFPGGARPGPHGPRQVYVGEELRDEEVVRRFDEHRRRSDTILGLYSTLFISKLRAERAAGTLNASDAALLDTLQL